MNKVEIIAIFVEASPSAGGLVFFIGNDSIWLT